MERLVPGGLLAYTGSEMPFVDLPFHHLSVPHSHRTPVQRSLAKTFSDPSTPCNRRQYYTINPSYEPNAQTSIKSEPPAAQEAIDDSKPILVFCHAATSSSHSFLYQVRTSLRYDRPTSGC